MTLALAGSLTLLSITSSRAVAETEAHKIAYYLAEAGLETAKREIGYLEDLGGDGMGNK